MVLANLELMTKPSETYEVTQETIRKNIHKVIDEAEIVAMISEDRSDNIAVIQFQYYSIPDWGVVVVSRSWPQ